MEALLSALIVAVLANLLVQYIQNWLNQKREDRKLLLQTLPILSKLKPHLDEYYAPQSQEIDELSRELILVAGGVHTRSYGKLADKLVDFVMKPDKRVDKLDELFKEVSEKVSKPINRGNKKEKQFFKKVAEELKQIMEKEDKARQKKGGENEKKELS